MSEKNSLTELMTATRGQAEQLDFLNAMIILLTGIFFFFTFSAVVLGFGFETDTAITQTAVNGDQRLVDDLLANTTGDAYLDRDCADDYFAMAANATCGITGFNTTAVNETHWLRHSLGIRDDRSINVTIRDEKTILTNSTGYQYALGEQPPADGGVRSTRYVSFSGTDYYIISVRVW